MYTKYWIDKDGYIWGSDHQISGKYWIKDDHIWGPNLKTAGKYWIQNKHIFGPDRETSGKFWIDWVGDKGYIWGPSEKLPWVRYSEDNEEED